MTGLCIQPFEVLGKNVAHGRVADGLNHVGQLDEGQFHLSGLQALDVFHQSRFEERFAFADFGGADGEVLVCNFLERGHVHHGQFRAFAETCIKVRGNAEVQHVQGTCGQHAGVFPREKGLVAAGADDDGCGSCCEGIRKRLEGPHLGGVQDVRQGLRALQGAVEDVDVVVAGLGEKASHGGVGGPCANHEDGRVLGEVPRLERLPTEGVDRDGLGGDVGVGEDFFGRFNHRTARHAEAVAGEPVIHGQVKRLSHLGQDFTLAKHHRLQAGGDAHQMTHGLFSPVNLHCSHDAGKRFRRQPKLLHEVGLPSHAEVLLVAHDELHTVAGRQENDSLQPQLNFPIGENCGLLVRGNMKEPHVLDGGVLKVQRQDLKVLNSHDRLQRCAQLPRQCVMQGSEVPVFSHRRMERFGHASRNV